jgi:hypothetical protein
MYLNTHKFSNRLPVITGQLHITFHIYTLVKLIFCVKYFPTSKHNYNLLKLLSTKLSSLDKIDLLLTVC